MQTPKVVAGPANGLLQQRKCACGGSATQGECDECKKGGTLQRRAVSSGAPSEIPPVVHEVLRSPGKPLDPATRVFFESQLGHDFSKVRVHADDRAVQSAKAIDALAYTLDSHVVLPSQAQNSDSGQDSRLLGHELVHVAQHERAGSRVTSEAETRINHRGESAEKEANALAARINRGARVQVREALAPGIYRQTQTGASSAQGNAAKEHLKEQENVAQLIEQMRQVKADPSKGYDHVDNLTHNALEWFSPAESSGPPLGSVGKQAPPKVELAVLSMTDDSMTRDRTQGWAYFDPTVKYPRTGGTYPPDASVKTDEHLKYAQPNVHGEFVQLAQTPYIALYAPVQFDYDELRKVLIHEVQHVADQHKPSFMFINSAAAGAKERYQTEFRAFWIQPESPPAPPSPFPSGPTQSFSVQQSPLNRDPVSVNNPAKCTACAQTGQSVPTHFKNQKQQNIFWYLKDVYKADAFDCLYVCDADFRVMVDNFSGPASVNAGESVRIQAVLEATEKINKTPGKLDQEMYGVVNAAKKLDNLDRQFLQDESASEPFWKKVNSRVPADWLPDITENLKFGQHGHPGDFELPKGDKATA